MKTWHLVGATLATLGVLAAAYASTAQIHSAKGSGPRTAARADDLPAQAPAPTAWRPIETVHLAPPAAAPPLAANAAPAPSSSGEAPPKRRPTPGEVRDACEVSFVSQNVDSGWAVSARRTAEQRIRERLPAGSSLRAVDCRTSFCRIETSHPDSAGYADFVQSTLMDPRACPWNGALFSAPLSDPDPNAPQKGPVVAVSFLAREGYDLPTPN
jgi:hypothetical protein